MDSQKSFPLSDSDSDELNEKLAAYNAAIAASNSARDALSTCIDMIEQAARDSVHPDFDRSVQPSSEEDLPLFGPDAEDQITRKEWEEYNAYLDEMAFLKSLPMAENYDTTRQTPHGDATPDADPDGTSVFHSWLTDAEE